MDLHRAQYFLEFVRCGTVTAAADSLGITQPALSRQLRRLEAELELELFDRNAGSMQLNDAGRMLIPICRKLVADGNYASRGVERIRRGQTQFLTVAATPTTISTVVAPFIVDAGTSIPLLRTLCTTHYDVYEALNATADLAISPLPALESYESVPLGQARVRAWVHPQHPYAQQSSASAEELAAEVLAIASRSSISRVLFDTFFSKSRAGLREIIECDDAATIMALARAGRAIAISSDLHARGVVPVEILDGAGAVGGVFLHVAWRRGHFAHREILHTARELRSYMRRQFNAPKED
ncbi:LysR family transcriptional regulator [Corynebacterium flavescens]|uniref:LysR family transcriptional regulator n=1 Tax=Corynebacterium flavescens TaxID=28028 RepID=UPI003FD55BD1